MDEQPVKSGLRKIWVCKKRNPYHDFFISRRSDFVKEARKRGFRCRRWHEMEGQDHATSLA